MFTLWDFDVFISRNGFIITLVIISTYSTVGYNDYDIFERMEKPGQEMDEKLNYKTHL